MNIAAFYHNNSVQVFNQTTMAMVARIRFSSGYYHVNAYSPYIKAINCAHIHQSHASLTELTNTLIDALVLPANSIGIIINECKKL